MRANILLGRAAHTTRTRPSEAEALESDSRNDTAREAEAQKKQVRGGGG